MIFRRKYIKAIKKNLLYDKNFTWFFNQLKNSFLMMLTVNTKKSLLPPILCGIVVTYRCNMQCVFCNLKERFHQQVELPEEKLKEIVIDFSSMGATGIGFTGGEPLLRKDIFNLIHFTKERKMATQLTTNGMLLSRDVCEKLVNSGLDDLGISLESHIPDIHDEIRGTNGSWQKVINGIETFIKVKKRVKGNTNITVSTVINQKNINQMEEFIEFCKEIEINNISFGVVQEEFAKTKIKVEDHNSYRQLLKSLIKYSRKRYMVDNSVEYLKEMLRGFSSNKPCWAGYHSIYVDCYGNIFPCFYYIEKNIAIDNLKNATLKKIWSKKNYNDLRKKLLRCKKCSFICQMELNALFNKFRFL